MKSVFKQIVEKLFMGIAFIFKENTHFKHWKTIFILNEAQALDQ